MRRTDGAGGTTAGQTPPALELRAVSKNFGPSEIIRRASLTVPVGQRCTLIGPNGAGKSTLFNLISGRFPPSSGEILLHGRQIGGLPPHQVNRLGLARSFQVTNVFGNLSVFENLRSAALWSLGVRYSFWQSLGRLAGVRERAEEVMELTGLTRRRDALAAGLSYAEQRSLEIGVTIAGGAQVLLLDEPTAGMSRSESEAAVEMIRKVSVGKTLLMVEHDMDVVFGLSDMVAVLVYGEVIACDTPANIRANPKVQEAYLGGSVPLEVA